MLDRARSRRDDWVGARRVGALTGESSRPSGRPADAAPGAPLDQRVGVDDHEIANVQAARNCSAVLELDEAERQVPRTPRHRAPPASPCARRGSSISPRAAARPAAAGDRHCRPRGARRGVETSSPRCREAPGVRALTNRPVHLQHEPRMVTIVQYAAQVAELDGDRLDVRPCPETRPTSRRVDPPWARRRRSDVALSTRSIETPRV